MYTGLPLYHSSGQWFAMGASVHGGCTIILRKSFSASKFWPDCVKYEATVTQYIGEIARFLLGNSNIFGIFDHVIKITLLFSKTTLSRGNST